MSVGARRTKGMESRSFGHPVNVMGVGSFSDIVRVAVSGMACCVGLSRNTGGFMGGSDVVLECVEVKGHILNMSC